MVIKKRARPKLPLVVTAVVRPVNARLSRMEDLLIEMRHEQDVQLKLSAALQEQIRSSEESRARVEIEMAESRAQLERLRADNQQLAQQRLDAAQLEQLADKQSQLAEQTTTATEPDQKEQLKKEQRELANDLDRLTQQNEAAKEALRAASAEEARRLSDQAKELAKAERDLDQAIRDAERSQNAAKLTDTAKKQADVADQLDRLTKKLKRALTAAQTNAPSGADAALTAETLRRGDADEAREQQRRTADALEQMADRLQNALNSARDPREAARQLSRLQEDTRRRTLDNSRPGMPDRDALIEEERTLQQAIDQLPVPDDQTGARREQIDAAGKAKQAITALQNGHSNTAADLMQRAGEALERLSGSLPSAQERQKTARAALAKVRQAQNQLSKQAQTAATQADRRPTTEETADLAKQQAELAEQLAKLDPPVATDRRDAARQAAGDALDDLMAKRWEDVLASQAELNRKLQQLDDAFQGKSSTDDKARDLARRQRELANEGRRASGDSAKMSALQAPQEQIAREVQDLNAAASLLQDEAAIATTRASQALRDQAGDAATPELLNEAAKKLDELANQLAGKESIPERAARLARQQQELAQATNLEDPAIRRRQNQIVHDAKELRAGDKATEEKKQAIDALERLRRLATNSTDYRPASRSASDALKRLAGKLAPLSDTGPEPSASELAQQQRDLAAATAAIPKQNGPARADSLEQAARQQRKLREQTNGMSSGTSPQAVQQARLAMAQAEQALARQEADQAKQLQFKAAAALDEAARNSAKRELAKTPASQPGVPSTEQIQQTRELARQLRQLEKEVKNSTSGVPPPADATQRQDAIAEQTEELATRLQQDISPPAANAARQAREAMGSANEQQSTDPAEARKSRQRAAEALDRAAEEAARKLDSEMRAGSPNPPPPGQTGQAILKARGKMQSAQQQLEKDKAESASKEMRGAAQSLQQAAKGMQGASDQKAQGSSQPGGDNPNGGDADGKRPPVSSDVAKELERHAGKKWGDLPGELRTRILQDVKAQYGDDYARIIRLYFESLADRK
jgi:hypothetical protein